MNSECECDSDCDCDYEVPVVKYYFPSPRGKLIVIDGVTYGRFLPKHFSDTGEVIDPLGIFPEYGKLGVNTSECSLENLPLLEWLRDFSLGLDKFGRPDQEALEDVFDTVYLVDV